MTKPVIRNGWIQKCDLDDYLDRHLPIPTQVVSNEEFFPLAQTQEQKAVEHRLLETASRHARRLGVDRRDFLRSAGGMAAAFAALNHVFGNFFRVDAAEMLEPGAADEAKVDYFVFDVQTHHVRSDRPFPLMNLLMDFRRTGGALNPKLKEHPPVKEDVYIENYVKEVFLDSETAVAALSGVPALADEENLLPPDQMARTRTLINRLVRSRRSVVHGLISPDLGAQNRERMQMQAEKLKIDAWKGYTGQGLGADKNGWWADDEKICYPTLEYSKKLKVRNICLHKGLALGLFNEEHCHPKDIVKASKDFPDLNFLVYHSGFKAIEAALPAAADGFKKTAYVPWVSDLCEMRRKNPHMKNVYMELGSTFGMTAVTQPVLCCHMLGMMIEAFGSDHILWGTDSVWWGSPQWQIEALRRLEMPEALAKQFGYKPLTPEVKRQIFGLNAARVYGVDPKARRNPVPGDYVDQLRKLYKQAGNPTPSNTQYGWVAAR